MHSIILLTSLSLHYVVQAELAQQQIGSLLPVGWDYRLSTGKEASTPCSVSRSAAFEQSEGQVDFSVSTTEHLETPKLSQLNSSAWEQWEFDGVSDSGMAGVIMGFSRDATYHFFGQGNLRVEFYMILEDGTVIQDLDYLQESTIITCQDSVTGIWNSSDRTYGFHVPKNMSRADVWWETSSSKGSLSIESDTPPHLADGKLWPSHAEDATVEMAPSLYFNQPIAGGRVIVEHTRGKNRLQISGRGGHGRLWALDGWFNICDGWDIIRASAGPYTLSMWRPVSRIHRGVPYYSGQLFKNGELIVGTQVGQVSDTDDYVLLDSDYSGNVTGTLEDRSTGHTVRFVSPQSGKTWHFLVEHKRRKFNMGLGGGKGLTGFTNRVTGGEVGGEQYEGVGFSEQVALPEEIKQWQIWVIYGIGFLGNWKNTIRNFVTDWVP
ncbi:hypothetical protein F4677DRAFT_95426 [Hypoxylon crocopeplum]|nr:hypothetical protein F4677DRAFT_95426 [Hypoxylon crocopeplum]